MHNMSPLMQVSMFQWMESGGGTVIDAAFVFFGFFCIFSQNYSLGTGNSSNLIEISLSGDNKTKVWGKFVVKISREGAKEVSKCHTFALTPPLHLNIGTGKMKSVSAREDIIFSHFRV